MTKEWQQEIKKARRGCLITIYNFTTRSFVLSNSRLPSGKWSDGCSSGPNVDQKEGEKEDDIEEPTNHATDVDAAKQETESTVVPPQKIGPGSYVVFGSVCKTMLTGTQGMVEYTPQGATAKLTFSWNLPKIGKERTESEAPKPFNIERGGILNKYSEIWFKITEEEAHKEEPKESTEPKDNRLSLSSSAEIPLSETELEALKEQDRKQNFLLSVMSKEEFSNEISAIEMAIVEQDPQQDPIEAIKAVEKFVKFAIDFIHSNDGKDRDEETKAKEAQINSFISTNLYNIVKSLVRKRTKDQKVKRVVNKFFTCVLDLVLACIYLENRQVLEILYKVFDKDEGFYDEDMATYKSAKDVSGEFASTTSSTSTFYIRPPSALIKHINYFGKQGGFAAIVNRIKSTSPKPGMGTVKLLLEPVAKIRRYLEAPFLENWVMDLKESICSLILNLTDQEFKETLDNDLTTVIELLDILLKQAYSEEEGNEIIERLKLELVLKCLKSDSLQKRVKALNDLNFLIKRSMRKKSSIYKVETATWLEVGFVITWLNETGILKQIFGQNMHQETVQRSSSIFVFLAKHDTIAHHHIDLIWDSCQGKGEDIGNIMYDILIEMAPLLKIPELKHILQKVETIPLVQYTKRTLSLIKVVTVSMMDCPEPKTKDSEKRRKAKGLQLLWNVIMHEGEGISKELATAASNKFNKIIKHPRAHSKRMRFIKNCVENIQNSKLVSQSLILLCKILQTYPVNGPVESISAIVESLQKENKIMDMFFNELLVHQEKVVMRRAPSVDTDMEKHSMVKKSETVDGHLEQLEKRLAFLNFIMDNSNTSITIPQLNVVWEYVIEKAPVEREKEVGFAWLETLCDKRMIINYEIIKSIFTSKLCTMDYTTISEAGFDCFRKYFRFINSHESKLRSSDTVVEFDMFGLDSLWRIVFEATHTEVVRAATDFLNSLYENLSPHLTTQKSKLREDYISILMAKLNHATVTKDANLVGRCLMLLKNFIEYTESINAINPRKTLQGEPLTLKFYPIKGLSSNSYFYIVVYSSNTLREVEWKVKDRVKDIEPKVKSVKLLANGGKELTDMGKTLEELRIVDRQTIYYEVSKSKGDKDSYHDASGIVVKKKEDDAITPRSILCGNQHYLDQLFNLFDSQDYQSKQVTLTVWELLLLLPTSPKVLKQFHSLSEQPKWEELLNSKSPFQLLYSLQILESIILEASKDADDNKKRATWALKFVSTGGFQHIYKILQQNPMELKEVEDQSIVESLLKITNFFMIDPQNDSSLRSEVLTSSWINYPQLLEKLVALIGSAAAKSIQCQSVILGEVVKYSKRLLVSCILSKPELLATFYKIPDLGIFVLEVIIRINSQKIREEMIDGICTLCTKVTNLSVSGITLPKDYFLPLLISFLSSIAKFPDYCEQYFDGLSVLIKNEPLTKDSRDLLTQIIELFKEHKVVERNEQDKEDKIIIGLMDLICTFVQLHPSLKVDIGPGPDGLMEELFKCLFELPTTAHKLKRHTLPPKCKTKSSRIIAFKLLEELVKDCSVNMTELTRLINTQHMSLFDNGYEVVEWNYSPSAEERAPVGYVGLRNLGCTCYMNSLMQQLYMMPRFRRGILSWEPKKDSSSQNKELLELMIQVQRAFAFLQESYKQYYDPTPFAFAYKDYEGNPTNVSIQMDVDEFFNILCEKLETQLKESLQEKLLQNVWATKMTTQLICKGCPHRSERDDLCYTISLDIKGKKNILEALKQYVQGEMLEGNNAYYCSACATHRDTVKRSVIKTLPDTLILHLKRFAFNLDTMRKIKVNDYCEFPKELDMFPYTKEGIASVEEDEEPRKVSADSEESLPTPDSESAVHPPSYYQYDLVGILVHSGDADAGHYYSYIKERTNSSVKPRWVEFNDKYTREFDIRKLSDECFGGTELIPKYSYYTGLSKTRSVDMEEVPKSRSAYMLIYERRKDTTENEPESPSSSPEQTLRKSDSDSAIDSGAQSNGMKTSSSGIFIASFFASKVLSKAKSRKADNIVTVDVPRDLLTEIWDDNMKFIRDKRLFDTDYFKFILNILQLDEQQPIKDYTKPLGTDASTQALQLATLFLIKIICKTKDHSTLPDFITQLKKKYSSNIPACKWFLSMLLSEPQPSGRMVILQLVYCPVTEVRDAFIDLVIHVVKSVLPFEEIFLQDKSKEDWKKATGLSFVDALLNFTLKNTVYKQFPQLLKMVHHLAKAAPVVRQFLLNRGTISKLVDLFMAVPLSESTSANFKKLVSILFTLGASCATKHTAKGSPPTQLEGPKLVLPPSEQEKLLSNQFFAKVLKQNINHKRMSRIAVHFAWENEALSESLIKLLMDIATAKTERHDIERIRHVFDVLNHILSLEDSLHKKRTKMFIVPFIDILNAKKDSADRTAECLEWVRQLQRINEPESEVRNWLRKNEAKWTWIPKWYKKAIASDPSIR